MMRHHRALLTAALFTSLLFVAACGGEDAPDDVAPAPAAPAAATAPRAKPEIGEVVIRPASPRSGDTLRVHTTWLPGGGDDAALLHQWIVGGGERSETGPELQLDDVSKGVQVEVVVTASVDGMQSEPVRRSVRVANAPPSVTRVALSPSPVARSGEELSARVEAADPDGDPVSLSYVWYVNGEPIYDVGSRLSGEQLRRGDEVTVAVTASDEEDDSEEVQSDAVRIENSPPRIVSKPVGFDANGAFHYTLEVDDADGDRSFAYRLLEAPEGMRIDAFGGVVSWTPDPSQVGKHPVKVEVDDRHGGLATQTFVLQLAYLDDGSTSPPAAPSP